MAVIKSPSKIEDFDFAEDYFEKKEMTKEQSEQAKLLTEQHWKYIHSLLTIHDIDDSTIEVVEFHYKSAMYHGIKHGCEDIEFN